MPDSNTGPPSANEPFARGSSFGSRVATDDAVLTNESFGAISATVADRGKSPEDEACFATRLLYNWLTPLIRAGVDAARGADGGPKRPLVLRDLPELPAEEFCDDVYRAAFLPVWEEELRNPADPTAGPSLATALRRAFGAQVYLGAAFRFVSDACQVSIPVVLQVQLRWIGRFVDDPEDHKDRMWEGYMLSVALMAMMLVFTYTFNASTFYTSKAFMKMRTACMLAIFDKAVKLPAAHGLTGRVSQMHGTDCSRFIETSFLVQMVWSAPIVVVACIVILYLFIGPAAFVGLAVAIVTIPMQGAAAKSMGDARSLASKLTDKRLERVNEFVQGIRIIKFMSWERQFEAKTEETRQAEMVHLVTMHKARAVFQMVLTYAPLVVVFGTFATAYALGNDMRASDVFPAFAILAILRVPLTIMPLAAAKMIELKVSVGRVNAFLLTAEHESVVRDVQPDSHVGDKDASAVHTLDLAVYIPRATVMSGHAPQQTPTDEESAQPIVDPKPLLALENFQIPRGKITVIVGPTAGGKSTLVNAIMGEALFSPDSTHVYRRGSVAFVPQEAWIMNATIRENILMSKAFDEDAYKCAVLACQLKPDFEQLASSDQTEIGERGINLSGGQKQRVAFARAVYSDRDIVVMDDPLSAVDPHVCGALFHTCIRTALSGKTRVLVTHQQQFLEWADQVVVVAERRVVFAGSYSEMQQCKEAMQYAAASNPGNVDGNDDSTDAANAVLAGEVEALRNIARDWEVPKPTRDDGASLVQAEKQDLTAIGWPIFKWYGEQSGWAAVLLTWALYTIWRAGTLFADLYLAWWATRAPAFGKYEHSGDEYVMWYGVAVAATGIFVVARAVPLTMGMVNASRHAHTRMVRALLKAPMSFFDTTPTGRILNRFSKDLEMLDAVVPEALSTFYNIFLTLAGAWLLQSVGAWPMPIVYAAVVVVFVHLFRGYVVTNHGVKRLEAVMNSPVLSIMNEALGGLPTIRAFGMVEPYRVTHSERLHDMNRTSYAWRNLQRWLGVRTDVLSAVVIGAIGMLVIAMLSLVSEERRHEFYPIAALGVTYSVIITGVVGFMTTLLAELIAAFSSVERVREYADHLEAEREVAYAETASSSALETDSSTGLPLTAPPPPPGWPKAGSLTFDDVFLRYRPGLDHVLRGVSFDVAAGEKVGIVGRTGSGKSTLMLALFRMIETDRTIDGGGSRILLDGVDIAALRTEDLRRSITIIPQDPVLFAGTIRSNLDPFNEHSDDELWRSLEKAHVKSRIDSEVAQLDAQVADRGANFSAGERQLLCLARALLKNCKVLLMDEATASIDPHHDQLLQQTIRREFADRTVLTIAHRVGTVIDSDKVLVLSTGRVAEFGRPRELLTKTGGAFAAMVRELGEDEAARLTSAANTTT